jgi:hypothetical protein
MHLRICRLVYPVSDGQRWPWAKEIQQRQQADTDEIKEAWKSCAIDDSLLVPLPAWLPISGSLIKVFSPSSSSCSCSSIFFDAPWLESLTVPPFFLSPCRAYIKIHSFYPNPSLSFFFPLVYSKHFQPCSPLFSHSPPSSLLSRSLQLWLPRPSNGVVGPSISQLALLRTLPEKHLRLICAPPPRLIGNCSFLL